LKIHLCTSIKGADAMQKMERSFCLVLANREGWPEVLARLAVVYLDFEARASKNYLNS